MPKPTIGSAVTLKDYKPAISYTEAKNLIDTFYLERNVENVAKKLRDHQYSPEEIQKARAVLEKCQENQFEDIDVLIYQITACKK